MATWADGYKCTDCGRELPSPGTCTDCLAKNQPVQERPGGDQPRNRRRTDKGGKK